MLSAAVTRSHVGRIWLAILSGLLLFFGFLLNTWRVAASEQFATHQRDTESLVLGRLVKSRQAGILSAGALNGAGVPRSLHVSWISDEQAERQYLTYLEGGTFDEYAPYLSQPGGQGLVFSVLDRTLPLSPRVKLWIFYILTSLLSATALGAIVAWFHSEFDAWVALWVAASMLFSQWLTLFGRNLWWSLWAFFLPMIATMYFLSRNPRSSDRSLAAFGILIFVCVFVKCFINGYEYITTTLLMMLAPLIFYDLREQTPLRVHSKWLVSAGIASVAAVALSLAILVLQISAVRGDLVDAGSHLVYSLDKRTYGDSASQHASVLSVVLTYLGGVFFDVGNYLSSASALIENWVFKVRYLYLVCLFAAASAIVALPRRDEGDKYARGRDHIAILGTTWVAILAPLSWYVIFKAHSYNHTHMNFLLWQMPFTFFGFATCALAVRRVFRMVRRSETSRGSGHHR